MLGDWGGNGKRGDHAEVMRADAQNLWSFGQLRGWAAQVIFSADLAADPAVNAFNPYLKWSYP